jgi:hypothetical protein
MLRCPVSSHATALTITTCGRAPAPNSSTAMIDSASGVFDAAANTAAKPTPALSASGIPSGPASALPSAAPRKNSGVTSPPRKPAPRVTAVNNSFSAKAHGAIVGSLNARTIPGTPSPR